MATEVTVTIKAAGGDYTSMSDFQTNYPNKDLVAQDIVLLVACDNIDDTTQLQLGGWTTDATRYLHFYAVDAHGSTGRITTSAYRLNVNYAAPALLIAGLGDGGKVIFEGIQFKNANTGASADVLNFNAQTTARTATFVKCVLDKGGAAPYAVGIGHTSTTKTLALEFVNCYIVGGSRTVFSESNGDIHIDMYHCTVAGGTQYGVASNGANTAAHLYNCYVHGGTSSLQVWQGAVTPHNTATSDADGDVPNVSYAASNFQDVTLGAEDLTLTVTSDCLNSGADLSANTAPLDCADDIDSGSRAVATPDCGADEYLATGTYNPPEGWSSGGGGAPPGYSAPPYTSPDNTFRSDFPYLRPQFETPYYNDSLPAPPSIHDWLGGA